MPWQRAGSRLLLAAGPLALAVLLAPALGGEAILAFRDLLQTYWPMKAATWETPGAALFTWNAGGYGGSSALADLLLQPFYLPNLAFRWLHLRAIPGLAWYLLLHAAFGHLGAYLLLRRATGREEAAAGALICTLGGFAVSNLPNVQFACTLSWTPWVLLAVDRVCERPSLRRLVLLGLCAPQPVLAGDPQIFLLLVLGGAGLAAARRQVAWSALLPRLALPGALCLLLAAPQLAATVRALPGFDRAEALTDEVRGQWALHPARLPGLFVPQLFGPLFGDGFWGGFTITGPWHRNYAHSLYLGAAFVPLLLAALWGKRRAALALLGVLALGAWIGAGPAGGLDRLLAAVVPTWKLYRYGERLGWVLELAGAALSALGLGVLFALPRARRLRLIAASLALGLAALGLEALLVRDGRLDAARGAQLHSALQLVVALGLTALAACAEGSVGKLLLGLVLLADLAAAHAELIALLPRGPFAQPSWACSAVLEAASAAGASPVSFRVFTEEQAIEQGRQPVPEEAHDLPDWGRQRAAQYQWGKRNLLQLCGLREAVALTSLQPAAELNLWRAAGARRTLAALAAHYAVVPAGSALRHAPGARVVSSQPGGGALLLELAASPRLYRPEAVIAMPSAEVERAVRTREDLLTPRLAALDGAPGLHQASPGETLAFDDRGDAIDFKVRHQQPGYWVLADALDADWTAAVDGAPAQLLTAELIHRALWLPAGEHAIALRHRPVALLGLFWASIAIAAAAAGLALWSGRMARAISVLRSPP